MTFIYYDDEIDKWCACLDSEHIRTIFGAEFTGPLTSLIDMLGCSNQLWAKGAGMERHLCGNKFKIHEMEDFGCKKRLESRHDPSAEIKYYGRFMNDVFGN